MKEAMTMQNYALANSNAMDGLTADSYLVRVRTWYDNLLAGLQAGFGLLTLAALIMYGRSRRKKEE